MTVNPPTGIVGALVVGFEVGGLVVGLEVVGFTVGCRAGVRIVVGLEVVGFAVGCRAGVRSVRTLGWEGGGDAGPTSEMREKYL